MPEPDDGNPLDRTIGIVKRSVGEKIKAAIAGTDPAQLYQWAISKGRRGGSQRAAVASPPAATITTVREGDEANPDAAEEHAAYWSDQSWQWAG